MKQKALSWLLALCLIVGLLPTAALAAGCLRCNGLAGTHQRPARCGHAGGDGRGRAGRGLCGGLRHL